MGDKLDRVLRYRNRAEQLKIIAAEDQSPKHRLALLGVATDYDRIADSLERGINEPGQAPGRGD